MKPFLYRMPVSATFWMEIYGDQEMGWYEWRLLDGEVLIDASCQGFGSPEAAARAGMKYVLKNVPF